jgi:hypothetical protein
MIYAFAYLFTLYILERTMSYRKGIIPAFKLRGQSKGDGFIEDYVNSNLGLIEDDIIQANERKDLFATTEIPTNYDVPFMENFRAQRCIYYHTLQALKKAEYIARIELIGRNQKQKAYIHARWVTKDDIEEEKYMDEFIMAHAIKPQVDGVKRTHPTLPTLPGRPGYSGHSEQPDEIKRARRRRAVKA